MLGAQWNRIPCLPHIDRRAVVCNRVSVAAPVGLRVDHELERSDLWARAADPDPLPPASQGADRRP